MSPTRATMSFMTPSEIVHELDKHIVGQHAAKRAVSIGLRNRWRRQQVAEPLRQEITPKNILMIGPTGVGKTEIARRVARLTESPFIKVEATKFTEVGYVGRDVESILRDLLEQTITQLHEDRVAEVEPRARVLADARLVETLHEANERQRAARVRPDETAASPEQSAAEARRARVRR